MAVDNTMRKLKIPPRFLPYMEKHRIYELFHDLGNELAIHRPPDPLKFLKTLLEHADKCRDKRIVVIIAPPFIDRIKLAHLISKKTGFGILSRYICVKNPVNYYCPVLLVKGVLDHLESSEQKDWILADFPDTIEEAEELIIEGVLATHTLLFQEEKSKFDGNEGEKIRCSFLYQEEGNKSVEKEKTKKINKLETTPSVMLNFENNEYRLKELFKSSLRLVKIRNRSLEELAEACAKITKKTPSKFAPKLFRVVLLGPRGSRRRTLARLISRQLNVVHVDMEQLLNMTRVSETKEGDELRSLDRNGYSYPLKTVFNLLKVRLGKEDCARRGYVLTNFPTSVEDFVLLDSLETPPNKVIFLDIDDVECKERLEDRMVNVHTGTLQSKAADPSNTDTLKHPDDEACKVENEIAFYKERLQDMREYCGETAFIIDGKGPINALLERVEDVLMSPAPVAKPRTGKLPPKLRRRESEISTDSRVGLHPRYSATQVVPMIESAELLRRFSDLKKRVVFRHESSFVDEDDFIMCEVNKEFDLALMGGVNKK